MPATRTLPVGALRPNDWNPNSMTDDEFGELVEEVRHLGHPPSPVVVREQGDAYVIVDGEHNWRAAREVGLTSLDCEVIDADDFEAMRQTYKRNLHGRHDPVRLGRLFERMMRERGLSRRALADEINVSEGTIRNALVFAEAEGLRNRYAKEGAPSTRRVEDLSVRQVRAYVGLPEPVRDYWLDAGAQLDDLSGVAQVRVGGRLASLAYDVESFADLADAGLLGTVTRRGFRRSVRRAFELFLWRSEAAHGAAADLDAYLKPVAELGLPVEVIDQHLLAVPRADGDGVEIPLAADEWDGILRDCVARAESRHAREAMLAESIRAASVEAVLRRQGLSMDDVDADELLRAFGSPAPGGEEEPPVHADLVDDVARALATALGDEEEGGRPVYDLARERMDALADPELALLAAYATGARAQAPRRWLDAVRGDGRHAEAAGNGGGLMRRFRR